MDTGNKKDTSHLGDDHQNKRAFFRDIFTEGMGEWLQGIKKYILPGALALLKYAL
ncbi:hypothetical protein J2Z37_004037 [Ammoniphilus resinae]|uniref:Uncharacterized protein n=1 Tax=Ammoniphilus resinae TaxID=861532 RepID=A0ABS4GUT4_9BACL|nr:hypothetical protein [Ammoniphilus resinae]